MEKGGFAALSLYLTGRTTLYEYDHSGRCIGSREQTTAGGDIAAYRYQYDPNSNLTRISQQLNGASWNTVYTYDGDNRAVTATVGSGKILTNAYDALGRLTSRSWNFAAPLSTALTYLAGANGSSTAMLGSYRNGSDTAYQYAYDAVGNISSVTRGNVSVTYTYDQANQLIRENNGFTNETVTYTYDGAGNLTAKNVYDYTTAATLGAPADTISYTYAASEWTDQLVGFDGETITYDNAGNPTTYLGTSLTWQGKRLTNVGANVSYSYNEDGLRLSKTVDGTTTQFFYNGSVLFGQTGGTNTLLYDYDAAGRVIAVRFNGTYYYYLRNGQGDVVKLVDGGGAAVVEYMYDSWGKQTSCTGTLATTLGVQNPFRYRGYFYDAETGWYYLQSRYYNPEVGRFLSADALMSTGQGVLGYNMYAYCGNNPVNASDPMGQDWWHWAVAAVVVIACAVAVVATAGGAAAAIGAVVAVSYGTAAATTGATVAAGAFIGSSVALGTSAAIAAANSSSLDDFAEQGSVGTIAATVTGGVVGAGYGYGVAASSQRRYAQSSGTPKNTSIDIEGGVCFVAGTSVLTMDGATPIEKVKTGDYVYATNPGTGKSGYKRVVQTFERETEELTVLTCGNETISTTPTHPFYVPHKGWTAAIDLRVGDILVTSNGEYVVVESVSHVLLEDPVTVYNFEVEDFHTYYVGDTGVLVHNTCKKPDIKQINDVAKQLGMNNITRREFGDYIESMKSGIPNNKNFTYQELVKFGREFLVK